MFWSNRQPDRIITRSRSASIGQSSSVSTPARTVNPVAIAKAEAKYEQAIADYKESGDATHWRYAQHCLDELEAARRGSDA